jgi:YegS/Rv2252/BmrU family lipid kinase
MQSYPYQRIKLIFNPLAGRSDASPFLLLEVITELQNQNFIPEVFLIEPGTDIYPVLDEALERRIRLYVVCGGDGTIESVSHWLIGKRAAMGIIPAGTQNNLALSMGIPGEIKTAIALLRKGQLSKMDVGIARSGDREIPFLEVCSVGLFSALFNSADNLQKGDLTSLGNILTTLASFPLAHINLVLDQKKVESLHGHVALVANLPYFGLNYRLTPNSPFDDGVLDVLVFTEFSKLELVGNVLQNTDDETVDERICRYKAHSLEIHTDPAMPVQVDGTPLGYTPVYITIKRKAISVMTGLPTPRQPRWRFLRNLNIFRFLKK